MKALSVIPGKVHSVEMIDVPQPEPTDAALLVKSRAIGICGTDAEIIAGGYGQAPLGEERLIIGHESIGEVVDAPPRSGFATGQLVVGVVRRPDPEPCDHCARGEWDMCRNGRFTECGIQKRHGYARELYNLEPECAVPIDPELGELGVLVEPASVVAKAGSLAVLFSRRSSVPPRTALITGAGPIGLLAALAATQYGLDTYVVDIVERGLKPDLVRALGAVYHSGPLSDLAISPDIVIECTGVGPLVREAANIAAPGAVIALTGLSAAEARVDLDLNLANRRIVSSNGVLFGSVNAARSHYEMAVRMLARAKPTWLRRLISRRVTLEHWPDAIDRRPDDVKVVLDMATAA
jgi:threonine dehydrogenase-like Zn-dependent dehydrogenase